MSIPCSSAAAIMSNSKPCISDSCPRARSLLHGSGTVGIEFINDFQIVADRIFGKFDSSLRPSAALSVESFPDECIPYFSLFLHLAHRYVVVGSGDSHCRDKRPFDKCIPRLMSGEISALLPLS